MSQHKRRVLVVGTTRDYIDHIRRRMPGRAVFLTDPQAQVDNEIPPIPEDEELVCPLTDEQAAVDRLRNFLERQNILLSGVACFDCESLLMASVVANKWGLPFPSRQSILYCRNKYLCKKRWANRGIPCPRGCDVHSLDDITDFMQETCGPVILKPLSGSGSELTFRCDSLDEASEVYETILKGLMARATDRMYYLNGKAGQASMICEEFVIGDEFSCDVYYDAGEVQVLRIARKYFQEKGAVGTTLAYEIPAKLPGTVGETIFKHYLKEAAKALGLTRSLCMVDFIWHDGLPYFLELSPRPGGDCLPPLIEQSCGVDMLGVMLDFAEGRPPMVPPSNTWEHLVGVRFYADRAGRLQSIRPQLLEWEENMRDLVWIKRPGDQIELPPKDYGSWLLGYGIFSPKTGLAIQDQLRDLVQAVAVDIV
ncbi:ATP-grasp domain-containing protein [Desulfovulcanus sp.]